MQKTLSIFGLTMVLGVMYAPMLSAQNTDGLTARQKTLLEQAQKKKEQRAIDLMGKIKPMLASKDPKQMRVAVTGLKKVARLYKTTSAGAEAQTILDRLKAEAELKAKIEGLGRKYRSTKAPDLRQQIFDQLMALGTQGRDHLAMLTRQELNLSLKRYADKFKKSAVAQVNLKRKAADGKKMVAAQKRITSLNGKVSKETIVKVADPALTELTEALMPQRDAVIAGDEAIDPLRQAVIDASGPWQKATGQTADDLLKEHERAMMLVALVYPNSAQGKVLMQNAELSPKLDPATADGVYETNRRRILSGLNPLLIDLKLCDASKDHSQDMVTLKFFAHDSPVKGKTTPWQRAANFKTSASAENIAAGMRRGHAAIQAWWHSPGHFANLIGRHNRIGLGRVNSTWTQMFGR